MERNRPASDGVRAFDPAQCMPLLEELLREGQTLWTVSNAYALSMTELLRLNPQIAKPNEVLSGTRVRVR